MWNIYQLLCEIYEYHEWKSAQFNISTQVYENLGMDHY